MRDSDWLNRAFGAIYIKDDEVGGVANVHF